MKEDLDLRSEHTHLEVKGIKGDLANFNKVNKDFLAAVRDKMVRILVFFLISCQVMLRKSVR